MASRAAELQRKAVITAAGAAVLGAAPALAMTHGYRWVGFLAIALQIVLLVLAVRFLAAGKRARAEGQ